MGITYCGPYADLINSYDHEGYAARKLPGGHLTSLWTHATREFLGYVAACSCGWSGVTVHPPTEQGKDDADLEWDREHLQPLIDEAKRAWHRWADQTGSRLRQVADLIRDHQFGQARDLLTRLTEQIQIRQRVAAELADSGRDQ